MTADFKELLLRAKDGDEESFTELLARYKPLLLRESVLHGVYDEDLYQENCITFLRCIRAISPQNAEFSRNNERESPNDHGLS